ncbi:hypothetical protein [Brachybacterium sp. FME24]|uniref:hypothetical protein n=1 Tax=Brachybacterium sp. FME24 TaxID=2742605 RepID=UPI001867EA01|nr:hypothetical protein [Brachybacterium sp. FME24]
MSTPQQRVHDATRRLLDLLEHGESLTPEAIALRGELAEATAEAGHFEDAFYQVDELLKDAQREYGPDHENVTRAREVIAVVEQIARRSVEGV